MKAISLWQPWASAIANGVKQFETRSWRTDYLGPIAIHAARKKDREARIIFEGLQNIPEFHAAFYVKGQDKFDDLPFGAIVATARICMVGEVEWFKISDLERALGDYTTGRFAWKLEEIKRLEQPVPCIGHQGFFNVNL